MSLKRLLSQWRADPSTGPNITNWHSTPDIPALFLPLPEDLNSELLAALHGQGITALYSHQIEAWNLAKTGKHIAVVTGTASGKTLCYNLPVLNTLLEDSEARALYIFPTKALAQDQANTLSSFSVNVQFFRRQEMKPAPGVVSVGLYDGDTPTSLRSSIRQNGRIILSNPDMLHTGILPHHTSWTEFFHNLRYVVIDEMHTYRGIFGSHVANVIRRLVRISKFYGAHPQFILTSATIANPRQLATQLLSLEYAEDELVIIDRDGSQHGQKYFLLYNPPIIDPDLGLRRSAVQESIRLANDLYQEDIQTVIFSRSRRGVEMLLTYLRSSGNDYANYKQNQKPSDQSVRGYRSGYLPAHRREIESGLRQGSVRTVVATNALELGVDIGGMGAAILVGYPGSIASTWQQAGRAGRGKDLALAIMVATPDPLDQFLVTHPNYIFSGSPEAALVNPDNLLILLSHLQCAAFELPFWDEERFGNLDRSVLHDLLEYLMEQKSIHHASARYYWIADRYPAQNVSLRSASAERVVLQEGNTSPTTVGEVDHASALWLVHPQAIYMHEGVNFVVENLDLERSIATLRRTDTDYFTEPRIETVIQLIQQREECSVAGGIKVHGEIKVTSQVTGFRKIRWYTNEQLGIGELDLPPSELITKGYWLSLAETTVDQLRSQGFWKNDANQYGSSWSQIRDLVRKRDGYRCMVCGVAEQGRAHDIHHKIPFRTFASPAQANQLSNLITLCPNCHHRVELAVRVRSGLSGLSFVLSHLAPLFLMCDPRDLGVHSDPQSALASGAPTVIIYEQVPDGIGLSEQLYQIHPDLLYSALELINKCLCADGCPSCVGPGGELGQGSKAETRAILQAMSSKI